MQLIRERNPKDVELAVSGCDVVIHVAAIIPPLADKKPKFAEAVNIGGTLNIIKAMIQSMKGVLIIMSFWFNSRDILNVPFA